MKKLTALCLSLLVGASAFAGVNPAAQKATANSTRVNAGEVKAVQSIAQPSRAKSNQIPGLAETGTKAMLKGTLAKRAMAKANVETDNIYGGLVYPKAGLCKINHDGSYTTMVSNPFDDVTISVLGVKDGKLKIMSSVQFWGMILGAYYTVVDLESGTVESHQTISADEIFIQIGGYVPDEDAFYGVANAGWIRFDCESKSAETLNPDWFDNNPEVPYNSFTWNSDQNFMAAINAASGTMFKVNLENGDYEEIGVAADAAGKYTGGLGYDAKSHSYLYNPNTDSESYFVSIDPNTFAVSEITEFTGSEEFSCFFVNEFKPVDPEGPASGKMVASSFELGATTGTVTFELPKTLNNGTSCEGQGLTYKLYINGTEYRSGSAKGGEQVVFSVNEAAGLGNGMVSFNLVCYNGTHEGKDGLAQLYVGKDTPQKPANVTLTPSKITWDAVPGGPTAGVHAGYVNADAIRYNVYLNDKVLVEGLKDTECATNLPANAELAKYNAKVVAVYDGMVSKPGVSNEIAFGSAFEIPVDFLPTDEEAEVFEVQNSNFDSATWVWNSEMGAWVYSYNSNEADDWLFLPPVNITDVESYYSFAFNVWGQSTSYPEKFEVYVGNSANAAAMTTQVIAPTDVEWTSQNVKTIDGLFSVPTPGKYFIGIHAISEPEMYNLFANNFSVSKSTVLAAGPAAITDVKATAGKEGALEATIEFKMPTKTNSGKTLDATKDVTCTLEGVVDLKTVTGKPGSAQKVTMTTLQGMNDITAQTSQAGVMGMISTIQIYTGIAPLSTVENLHFEMGEDNLSGVLKWEAPTESTMEGGYIKQTGIKYYLCQLQQSIFGSSWVVAGEIGTDVFEFPFSIAEQPQASLQLGIVCENEAGMADYLQSAIVSAGTPWEVPAYENWVLADGKTGINYQSVIISSPLYDENDASTQVDFGFRNNLTGDMDTNGEYVFVGKCNGNVYGEVHLPAFSTLGQNKVAFIPEVFVGGCKNIKVYAESWDVASEEILDLDAVIGMDTNEYQAIQINLPAKFQNKSWVRIVIRPYFEAGKETFVLKNYKFRNMVNNDLRVAVSGATKANVGEPAKYVADVENIGLMATSFKGGTFKVTDAEGKVIAEKTVSANTEVAVDGTVSSEAFEFTPTIEQVGDVTVSFTLAGSDDNTANNSAKMTVNVVKGKAVVVDDLRGEAVADGKVQLDWTEVQIKSGFESFEDMTPFELSGTNIGQFTQVKHDEIGVYSWSGNAALKELLANVQYKSGFNVYNGPALDDAFGKEGMWPATDGEQFLIVFCPGEQEDGSLPDADDWLISPAVKGGSEFSFDIRPLINQYGKEKIELCYSTTDGVDPKDFKVLKTIEVGSDDPEADTVWETISETLPENAKRFAIHYVSHDVMGICIDKIEWTPASGNLSVSMYEVYRQAEGEEAFVKVGEATANSFIDETANTSVINKYYVIPVLSDKTKGLKSNVAEVKAYVSGVVDLLSSQAIVAGKGTIVIRGFEGEKVVISTADGKVVASGVAKDETSVKVEAGVYIVKAGKRAAKLIVR